MFKKIGLISLLFIPVISSAAEKQQPRPPMAKPQGLSVGLGVAGSTGVYIGEKTEVIPVPVISYESDRFFVRGLTAGAQVYAERFFAVNAITSVNMMNLDVDDLSASNLSAKNINKSQLEDRDRSVDLGLEGIVRLPYGIFSMQAVNDIGGASDGAELRFNYQYLWRMNPQLTLIPNLGLDWLSDKRANYYYGTLGAEVARGIEAYQPDNVFIPHVSLGANYKLTDKLSFSGVAMQKFLPDDVKKGPLIDKSSSTNFYMGVSYKF